MFFCFRDGSGRIPLESERSRTELWSVMTSVLTGAYVQGPTSSLKQVARLLDKLDLVDGRIAELESRYEELLESENADPRKLDRLQRELASEREARKKLLGQVTLASSIEL